MKLNKEMKKLKTILDSVADDRKPIADNIFKELVFIEETLEDLKKQIKERGSIDLFKQGKQEFYRESPALKGYNTTIQRYNLLFKQLVDLLPPSQVDDKDELLEFIKE